jgi:putative peptidoglycan lipid II flippase
VILLFTPMAVCLYMLRLPVVKLLFEHGVFGAGSTQLTVMALTYYAFGLVSFAIELLLVRTFFSLSDTMTPTIIEVLTLATHVGLIIVLRGSLAHSAIALAFTISKTLKALALYGCLKRRLGTIHFSENLAFLGKLLSAAGIMMVMMWGYQFWFLSYFALDTMAAQAILIVTSGALGTGVFLTIMFWLKVSEVRLIWQALLNYITRKFRTTNQ